MQVSPPVPRVTSQEIQTSGDLMKLVELSHDGAIPDHIAKVSYMKYIDNNNKKKKTATASITSTTTTTASTTTGATLVIRVTTATQQGC